MTDNGQPSAARDYQTFLLADCGHTNTTVTLIDLIDGTYRFVAYGSAPTTFAPPYNDIAHGIYHAIQQIAEITHRTFFDEQGQLITPADEQGMGVDYFGLTVSVTGPFKGIVMGLLDDLSVVRAKNILHTVPAHERETFSISHRQPIQRQVDAFRFHKPDVVIITGGTNHGAEEQVMRLVDIASIGLGQLTREERGQIIYAGNRALREQVTESIGGVASVHMADNVLPQAEVQQLTDAKRIIQEMYQALKVNKLDGLAEIESWLAAEPQVTSQAVSKICQYMATVVNGRVLAIDVGSDTVSVISATTDNVESAIYGNLGTGRPITNLLRQSSTANILRWIPDPLREEGLIIDVHNISLYPNTVPGTARRLRLLQALLREIIHYVVTEAAANYSWEHGRVPAPKLMILQGSSLTGLPRPAQAILTALDAAQPVGTFAVTMDAQNILPGLGSLAEEHPLTAVQVLEQGVLQDLGWVVVVSGRGSIGDEVMEVKVETAEMGESQQTILWGSLNILPLPAGVEATVTLKPTRNYDVGFGVGKQQTLTVQGGEVGLVIDARGRPLPMYTETEIEKQRTMVLQWIWDMGG